MHVCIMYIIYGVRHHGSDHSESKRTLILWERGEYLDQFPKECSNAHHDSTVNETR